MPPGLDEEQPKTLTRKDLGKSTRNTPYMHPQPPLAGDLPGPAESHPRSAPGNHQQVGPDF
eukprot:3801753-Alexandrium_andersonii.AAC.1